MARSVAETVTSAVPMVVTLKVAAMAMTALDNIYSIIPLKKDHKEIEFFLKMNGSKTFKSLRNKGCNHCKMICKD